MKRLLFLFTIGFALVCNVQAARVDETAARQVANQFFSATSFRLMAQPGAPDVRLAYTAPEGRFYVYDRGTEGGFVVIAGDDRLPQVLAHGATGDFASRILPPAVQYWMDEMNRQIAFLQAHSDAAAYRPIKRAAVVDPLLTTRWSQEAPYNDLCPTYSTSSGAPQRAVTGCVATAVAQAMNYYRWPDVGRGSHSYFCNVNGSTGTELSVDFSQSQYQWDLMLDDYDEASSPESREAVAKLMLDVGISMNMSYGNSSGAYESDAMLALQRYFKYNDNCYLLHRDYYSAEEWDCFLIKEITASRPVIYCGYSISATSSSGHCFVLDGIDADGYYHVNWGWGGYYDGYFLVAALAPASGTDFKYMQDGIFGLVPEERADEIEDVMYIRTQLLPEKPSVRLGETAALKTENFMVEGNMLDTAGYEQVGERGFYYALIPMSLSIIDGNGVECQNTRFDYKHALDDRWFSQGEMMYIDLLPTLAEGDYKVKLTYSLDGVNYDQETLDFTSKELYVKMHVQNDSAYFSDCFLSNTYSLDSFVVPRGITINSPFTVGVNISYFEPWRDEDGPTGNVRLSLLRDGEELDTSEWCEVKVHTNEVKTYEIELMAPAEWGKYDLALSDESGNRMMKMEGWFGETSESVEHILVLPPCHELVEDFESMTANNSTSDKNVVGTFTTWDFNKSGVRAPGEGKCNGTNAVMMKKPSTFTTAQPLGRDFFLAQAVFFNPASTVAKYRLTYSVDNGANWQTANTYDGEDHV